MTQPLLLEELSIVRLAGIDEPFAVQSLSPGVNLVFGPNASGKSSLIRAIELVLWPPLHKRPLVTISARFHLAGDTWEIRVDGDSTRALRNGAPASVPVLPSPELRHRYRLSLHDLLGSESGDGGFAAAIARASVGGLDLGAAADRLGFADKPPARLQVRSDWDANRRALDNARQRARALQREAEALIELDRARADAAAAQHELTRLDAALRVCAADERLREAEDALSALPDTIDALSGREADDAEALLVAWRQLLSARARAGQQREDAQQRMRELFDVRVPAEEERLAWRALARRLREYDDQLARDQVSLASSTAEREHARPHDRLAPLDRATLETLVGFARRFERAHGALLAAEQHRDALCPGDVHGAPGEELPADSLRDLLRVLTQWLAADARESARPTAGVLWWGMLLALAVSGWVILAVRWHWAAAIGAVVAVLSVVLMRRTEPRVAPDAERLTREYTALWGSPLPAWDRDHVLAALDVVTRALAAARAREHDHVRRRDAERAVVQARAQFTPLEAERAALASRFGVVPDADAQMLPWFVHQLITWDEAHRAVIALEARIRAVQASRTDVCEELATLLAGIGESIPDSSARLEGLLDALDARTDSHREAARLRGDADRALQTMHEELAALRAAWRTLLERASIAWTELPEEMQVQHEQRLRDTVAVFELRVGQYRQFQELAQRRRDALRDHEVAAAPYQEDDTFAALTRQPPEMLRALREETATRASAYTTLVERAAALRQRVDDAKQSHDVEAALARFEESGAELARAQQASLEAMVGSALLEHVQSATRDVHRPAVFHRARELFARITHGRWQLTLEEDDAGEPTFRAIDSRTLRVCPLEELSSGTRVQLLVAVRMAFVEITEGSVRLPLFLDEALGTSDDQRAQALIDAALELVRDGRQLFYFTAQRDEVEKWRTTLTGRGLRWQEFDLAQLRRGYERDVVAPPRVHVAPAVRPALPDPERHTHEQYGAVLEIPEVRAGFTPAGATHPWYVIEDVRVLHEVLSLGVTTWGELQWYVDANGQFSESVVAPERYATALGRARLLMRAVDVLHRESRVGRGDPVDRTRLLEAGVSSERLLDAVSAVAEACSGEASALLERLDNGAAPGFGPQRVTQLRERLQQIGCLDPSPPRSANEIRLAMIAAVHHALEPGDVDGVLARIAAVRDRVMQDHVAREDTPRDRTLDPGILFPKDPKPAEQ